MISKAALKASAKARREGAPKCGYRAVLKEGERAYFAGHPLAANPYAAGSEDAEVWAEGWEDARHVDV
jgi:hypothetical protein